MPVRRGRPPPGRRPRGRPLSPRRGRGTCGGSGLMWMTWSSFLDVRGGRRSGALRGTIPTRSLIRYFLPVMNGPRVQVHRREGKRRSPDPGDLRAIYGGHPDRVPVTAGPGGPIVRRDLAATPDRAARRRVTIISAPAGVPPGGARGVPRGRQPATSAWRARSL